ncbi:MAG TPA: LysE family translocator [Burkholderiaceae bacterium]|jgi:threonine/homoserine/homoserine lactone efflux protein
MISADTLVLFVLTSLALAITPGPTMLLALSNGIVAGRRTALFGILGATLANLLLITLVALGLGVVLAASEILFNALRYVGVAYLCWLGFKLWRARSLAIDQAALVEGRQILPPKRAFVRSVSVALSNPKGLLFFSAFLPQFVSPAHAQAPQYAELALIFVSLDAVVMFSYATAGTNAVRYLSARGLLVIHRACAVAMFALAAALAIARRGNA